MENELAHIKGLTDPNDPAAAVAFDSSKPFDEIVLEGAVRKLTKPYKKLKGAKITGVPKKHKPKPKKGTVINRKKSRSKKGRISLSKGATATSKANSGAEKGVGRETDTQSVADLQRLKNAINKRLPAEVRRNMGRPALMNRTGRFSNSVQLLELYPAKETMMAKYTYMLSPYETFENTGRKQWPLAYNPKTLIAKSIRNLAVGQIAQKLTLRRT